MKCIIIGKCWYIISLISEVHGQCITHEQCINLWCKNAQVTLIFTETLSLIPPLNLKVLCKVNALLATGFKYELLFVVRGLKWALTSRMGVVLWPRSQTAWPESRRRRQGRWGRRCLLCSTCGAGVTGRGGDRAGTPGCGGSGGHTGTGRNTDIWEKQAPKPR